MPCSRRVLASRPAAGPGPRLTPAPRALVCPRVPRPGCYVRHSRPGRAPPRTRTSRYGRAAPSPPNRPARRARPGGGKPPVHLHERAPGAAGLVVEHPEECRPSGVGHRPGQPGAASPDTARSSTAISWFSRPGGGQLVQPVPAGVGHPGMAAGHLPPGPLPAGGALLAAREFLCARASFAAALRPWRGLSTFRPPDSTAKCTRPRSIPTSASTGGSGWSGTSNDERRPVPARRVHAHRDRRRNAG